MSHSEMGTGITRFQGLGVIFSLLYAKFQQNIFSLILKNLVSPAEAFLIMVERTVLSTMFLIMGSQFIMGYPQRPSPVFLAL